MQARKVWAGQEIDRLSSCQLKIKTTCLSTRSTSTWCRKRKSPYYFPTVKQKWMTCLKRERNAILERPLKIRVRPNSSCQTHPWIQLSSKAQTQCIASRSDKSLGRIGPKVQKQALTCNRCLRIFLTRMETSSSLKIRCQKRTKVGSFYLKRVVIRRQSQVRVKALKFQTGKLW